MKKKPVKKTKAVKKATKKVTKPSKTYAVVRTMFGDYWVGYCYKPVDDLRIFSTPREAFANARDRVCEDGFNEERTEEAIYELERAEELADIGEEPLEEAKLEFLASE